MFRVGPFSTVKPTINFSVVKLVDMVGIWLLTFDAITPTASFLIAMLKEVIAV